MARKDVNQTAFLIVGIATGEIEKPVKKNGHTVERARKAGLVGGKARAEKLTKKERVTIAKNAASKRWNKKK